MDDNMKKGMNILGGISKVLDPETKICFSPYDLIKEYVNKTIVLDQPYIAVAGSILITVFISWMWYS